MNTLFLLPQSWDLTVDALGNIAMASDPYSVAQDAASEIKLFAGEEWYDTTNGIPYFQKILGKYPPMTLVKALFEKAALRVPTVTQALAIPIISNGVLGGSVNVTTPSGVASLSFLR